MKVRFSTLQYWIPSLELSAEESAELLTRKSYEVEEVEYLGSAWDNMMVGYVQTVEAHPDADRLRIAVTDIGREEPVRIVCGADNLEQGQYVPVALEGAQLPDGTQITHNTIRGVTSEGMICSRQELGLEEESSGIMVFSDEEEVGKSLAAALGDDDYILEIDTTALGPRASDSMSYYGLARELAALTGNSLREIETITPAQEGTFNVQRDETLCRRYLTLEANAVEHLAMPHLRDIGELSQSPLVDLSNYVMEEIGQPVHMFDADKLTGSTITIREAEEGEEFVILGGTPIVLAQGDIVITDEEKIIALAGVIGGESSKVDADTERILVESATFDSRRVLRTSRRLHLLTDAAKRFEKGLPVELARIGAERVAWYLEQMEQFVVKEGDARMGVEEFSWHLEERRLDLGGLSDYGHSKTEHSSIELSPSYISSYLGVTLEASEVQKYLKTVGCEVEGGDFGGFFGGGNEDGSLIITPPWYRTDLSTPEELIEEVSRLYGYEEIPADTNFSLQLAERDPFYEFCKQVRYTLSGLGYDEIHTYPYAASGYVRLANPVSEEYPFMRDSLRNGMQEAVEKNQHWRAPVRMFEIAQVFLPEGEETHLSLYIRSDSSVDESRHFQCVRAALHHILQEQYIREDSLQITQEESGVLQLKYADVPIGTYTVSDRVLEISLSDLYANAQTYTPIFRPLPDYPAVKRDVTLSISDDISTEVVHKLFEQYRDQSKWCERATFEDIYYHESSKNVTFHLEYRADDHSLSDDEVNTEVERLISAVQSEIDAEWV